MKTALVDNLLQGQLPTVKVEVDIPLDTIATLCAGAFVTAVLIFFSIRLIKSFI